MKKPIPVRKSTRSTFRPVLEQLESRLTPAIYAVSSLADSGEGSLRAAITSANGDNTPDEINFSVAGVIQLTSGPLPAVTNTVKIDGSTVPSFAGVPLVEIDNHGFAGLVLSAPNSTLASLSIVNANGPGVSLEGGSDSIVGSYVGLALDKTVAANTGVGVFVELTNQQLGGTFGTVGGTSAGDGNVISGNGAGGIQLGTSGEKFLQAVNILGNLIGTFPNGHDPAPNQGNGITVFSDGANNIGGTATGAANTIAFNTRVGVLIDGSAGPINFFDQQTAILSNSIFKNGSGGIVLQNNGNENMPAPQLAYGVESSINPFFMRVQAGGVLNAASIVPPGSTGLSCLIQVFATPDVSPGQFLVGSVQVTTDANGFATFMVSNPQLPVSLYTFTATATIASADFSSFGSTSSFSNGVGGDSTANQVYVANVYQQLLKRVPDPSSSAWVSALNSGASPASVVLGIEGSTEYLNLQVIGLYQRYLGRNPDADGEQFWTSALQSGATLESVAAQLLASSEYFVLTGGTNSTFLAGLYSQVLGRPGSSAEVAGWETVLDNGASRFFVTSEFLVSQEYRANLVQADYMTFLKRPADSGGLMTWVGALNAGATDQQVLAQIFGSAEGYQVWS